MNYFNVEIFYAVQWWRLTYIDFIYILFILNIRFAHEDIEQRKKYLMSKLDQINKAIVDDYDNFYGNYDEDQYDVPFRTEKYSGNSDIKENFERYKENLHKYFCQHSDTDPLSSFAYGTLIKNREEVYLALKKNQIECRPLICGNIARHPFWEKREGVEQLINANKIHDYGIYLPNHNNLTLKDIDRVCEVFSKSAIPINFS